MPMPMRPWTIRVLELVDSGVTCEEEVIRQGSPWVPMGHAFRVREQRNQYFRERHVATGPVMGPRKVSQAEMHRVGARQVLRKAIQGLVRDGHLVRSGGHLHRPIRSEAQMPSHGCAVEEGL